MIITITKFLQHFKFINDNYKQDFITLFRVLAKDRNIQKTCIDYIKQNNSASLKKECEQFLLYNNINFYYAWAMSFSDPIMSQIMCTKNLKLLISYVEQKYTFWNNNFNKLLYAYIIFFTCCITSKSFLVLFNLSLNIYLYSFVLFIIILHFIYYYLILRIMINTYDIFLKQYMYLQYLDQKCSLEELLYINPINIYRIYPISKFTYNNEDMNNNFLHKKWEIIHYIPLLFSGIIIFLCMIFLFFIMSYVIRVFIDTYSNILSF
jgi:hypothetical protein